MIVRGVVRASGMEKVSGSDAQANTGAAGGVRFVTGLAKDTGISAFNASPRRLRKEDQTRFRDTERQNFQFA